MPLGVEHIGRAFANRAKRGLYAGRRVLFGNRVSEDGGNRTRRKWLPNVQNKRIYSEQLDQMIQLKVTTGAMRNMDKAGGLDAYLWKIKGSREDSEKAEQLRQQLTQHKELQEKLQRLQAQDAKRQQSRKRKKWSQQLLPAAATALDGEGVSAVQQ